MASTTAATGTHSVSRFSVSTSELAEAVLGKTVIISDGCVITGFIAAKAFAQKGCTKIGLIGGDVSALEHNKAAIASISPAINVHVAVVDLSSSQSVGIAAHELRIALGAWDVFIHNAAHQPRRTTLAGADEDDWFRAFQVNVLFYKHFATHFSPKARPNATLIAVTDAIDEKHVEERSRESGWAASQAAAARCRAYLVEEKQGLRLFTITTDMTKLRRPAAESDSNQDLGDEIKVLGTLYPWLVSPQADFLQGEYVSVKWFAAELLKRSPELLQEREVLQNGHTGANSS